MRRKRGKFTGLKAMTLEAQAEAEARRIARDAGVSEGLWELFLVDAYRRISGLDRQSAAVGEERK